MARKNEDVVFLSHNSADKPAVEEIKRRLESCEPPFDCWLDKDDLRSRGTWMEQIEKILAECQSAALFFGPSGRGPIHDLERQKLIERAARQRDSFWLVPVLLPGAKKDDVDGFASLYNWVDFRDGLDSPAALERLSNLLRGEAPGTISEDDQITGEPYRGLERFEGEHACYFFGRDREIQELCERLPTWPFVAVIGGSGSGKSSLVRAGLQTTLAVQELPQLKDAVRITVLPGSNPLRALADQVAAMVPKESGELPEAMADAFENRFRERPDGLLTLLTSRFPSEEQFVLLLVDQFEELFTHCQDPPDTTGHCREQIQKFVDLLDAVARSGVNRLRIVITLRADFFDRCLQVPRLVPLVQNHELLLGELTTEAIRDVIVKPAQHAGAFFEKGLVARILAEVEDETGSLPLLQYALKELWAKRRGRWLTNEDYDKTGGVSGALRKRADKTLNSLTPDQREIAKNIFLRLTTIGEGVGHTRRRVKLADLYPADEMLRSTVVEVIDHLRSNKARLIVTNDDGTAEVTHETLLRRWDQLKTWLDTNREEKQLQVQLRDAADQWHNTFPANPGRRDESYLWGGGRVDDAERFDRSHPGALNKIERAFLRASVKRRGRRVRNLLLLSGSLAVALVVATFFFVVARSARDKALEQERIADSERDKALEQERIANSARDKAREQERIANSERLRAQEGFDTARNALKTLLAKVADETLVNRPGMQPLQLALYGELSDYCQKFLMAWGDDPRLREDAALAHFGIGMYLDKINDSKKALESFAKARDIQMELVDSKNRPNASKLLEDLSNTHTQIANIQVRQSQYLSAIATYSNALALRTELVKMDPGRPESSRKLANAYMNSGQAKQGNGDIAGARTDFETAQTTRTNILKAHADSPLVVQDVTRDFAKGYYGLGNLDYIARKYETASENFQKAATDSKKVLDADREDLENKWQLGVSLQRLGDARVWLKQFKEAKTDFDQALSHLEPLAKQNPDVGKYQHDLAMLFGSLANLEYNLPNYAVAISNREKQVEILENLTGGDEGTRDDYSDLGMARFYMLHPLLKEFETGRIEPPRLEAKAKALVDYLDKCNEKFPDAEWVAKLYGLTADFEHTKGTNHKLEIVLREKQEKILKRRADGDPQNASYHSELGMAHLYILHAMQAEPEVDNIELEARAKALVDYLDKCNEQFQNAEWVAKLYGLTADFAFKKRRNHQLAISFREKQEKILKRLADGAPDNASYASELGNTRLQVLRMNKLEGQELEKREQELRDYLTDCKQQSMGKPEEDVFVKLLKELDALVGRKEANGGNDG